MTDIQGKTILVTGAAGGFGQQFIRQGLAAGGRLILTDRQGASLESCAQMIHDEVGSGEIVQCIESDLSTPDGCAALAQSVTQTPDVLINNAGLGNFGRFDEIPSDQWERLMQVNLLAPMRLVSLFMPDMIARRSGHIVNISSVAGWIGMGGLAAYSASKYGLRGFSESLVEELAPYNIHVTTVFPFYSRTPILNAPRYGSLTAGELPDSVTSDPAQVIREVMEGIRLNKAHVFPDPTARKLHWIKRLVPRLIPILTRQSSKKA
jgi:short-subunit dehydrogenase